MGGSESMQEFATRYIAKIGDLGDAYEMKKMEIFITEPKGSSGYTAPEVFEGSGYSYPCDIFSFGVIILEVLSNDKDNPFCGMDSDRYLEELRNGKRLPFSAHHIPEELLDIWQSCWHFNPSRRPTADNLVQKLVNIRNRIVSSIIEEEKEKQVKKRIAGNTKSISKDFHGNDTAYLASRIDKMNKRHGTKINMLRIDHTASLTRSLNGTLLPRSNVPRAF